MARSSGRAPAGRELSLVALLALATALLAFAGSHKLGTAGLLAPLVVVLAILLIRRPLVLVTLTTGLVILCEGPTFGLLSFTSHLYGDIYRKLTAVDALVALTIVSIGLDLIVNRRSIRIPRSLAFAAVMLALAMACGAVVGHATGLGVRSVLLGENVLAYLLLLPIAVANLDLDERQIKLLLAGAMGMAIVKSFLGLIEIAAHKGAPIEGSSTLTYYEPTANWLIMLAVFGVLAGAVLRARLPRWTLLGTPFLIASLLLSYRRSFWIAAVLGILLVLLLGSTSSGRRAMVPVALLVVAAIMVLGSVNFQSAQSPIVRRVASLEPSKLETNIEDRYRLDERTNVIDTIREHPITGLGVLVPWSPVFTPLSVEHPEARLYVHFAVLWYWLKLGVLGLFAYLAILAAAAVCAWRVWRFNGDTTLRVFGLASLCSLFGLVAIETTATFTGVDPRFTVVLGVQIGLLALLAGTREGPDGVQVTPPGLLVR